MVPLALYPQCSAIIHIASGLVSSIFSLFILAGLNDFVHSESKCRCCGWNRKNCAIMSWLLKFITLWILQAVISFAAFGMSLLDANCIFVLKTRNLLALGIGKQLKEML